MITDETAVRGLIQQWMEASARGDYDALERLMHPEIVFLTSGNPPMGRDAFRDAFLNLVKVMQLEGTTYIRDVEVSGDLAYACTWIEVRMVPLSGAPPLERKGYALSVYKRNPEGAWQLWRDANLMLD